MGTGRRLTYLVTVVALVLGLIGSVATTRAARPSQGLDTLALQSQDNCPTGTTFVAKVELGGRNGQKFTENQEVTLTTTAGGSVTIRVDSVNGEGEILSFTVVDASFSLAGVIVVGKFGNEIVGTTSPNGNALSNFTLCAAAATPTATMEAATETATMEAATETATMEAATETATMEAATETMTITPVASVVTEVPGTSTATTPAETGNIAVFKFLCESIGDQNTCNGRDDLLDGFEIDFQVFAGDDNTGELVDTITVTLGENANENGNTGGGSQGREVGIDLPIGTFTVCEVEIARGPNGERIPLVAQPRPEAGNGGSTGGTNQTLFGTNCITVTITAGTAELKFLDTIAPTPTATATSTLPVDEGTATNTPVSSVTNTPVSSVTVTPVASAETIVPGTETPTVPAGSTATSTPVGTATATSTLPVGAVTETPVVPTATGTLPVDQATETPVVPTATGTAPAAAETEVPSSTSTPGPGVTAVVGAATEAPVSGVPNTGAGSDGGRGIQSSQMALLILLLLGAMAAFGGLVRQTRGQRD